MEKVSYMECLRNHANLNGKPDGCQEFQDDWREFNTCAVCDCNRGYHRKVIEITPVRYVTEVVYTKCHKIHNFDLLNSVDGCQEFMPHGGDGLTCAVCGCHKGFHRNEITKEEKVSD